MTEFQLMELIGEADDQYIMESRKRPKPKKRGFRWAYAVAAVLAVAVIGTVGTLYFRGQNSNAAATESARKKA